MKNILITGGAGFVGRHFTKRLLEEGHTVTVVDNIKELCGGIHPVDWAHVPSIEMDPTDYDTFTYYNIDCRDYFKMFPEHSPDIAIHLAAVVGGRMMIDHDPLAVADDLSIDASYWSWAKRAKPGKSIIFSSSAAYPIALQTQLNKTMLSEEMLDINSNIIRQPDMTYGWSKLTMEYLTHTAWEKYGLESVIFRPFSGYGTDQDLTYPFPAIINRALNHTPNADIPFYVWGSGQQVRDFIHIEDIVTSALKVAAQHSGAPTTVNLSSGIGTSFIELAEEILEQLQKNQAPVHGSTDKPEGVFYRVGSTTFQESLGLETTIPLADGISLALNSFIKSYD